MNLTLCVCGNTHKRTERCGRCTKGTKMGHQQTTAERGYGYDWRKLSQRIRTENPLCVDCEANGKVTPATECHHIVKIKHSPADRLNIDNVLPLCQKCHQQRTDRGE